MSERSIEKAKRTSKVHTAYHEIGHALAAHVLRCQFDSVSVVSRPDERTAGRVGVEGDDCFYVLPGTDPFSAENNRAYRKWAYAQSTIDYAGHAAIVALLGLGKMTYRSARAHGACSDFEKARERLGNDGRLMERAQQRALRIVSTRRFTKAIHERIVPALCERGVLDPQEFEWMLYRKEPWPFSCDDR